MDYQTIDQLVKINRQFYQSCAHSFSQTRQRVQPGVDRIIQHYISPFFFCNLLDAACGNADILPALENANFRGYYTGIDFSTRLLHENIHQPEMFTARFLERDLSETDWSSDLMRNSFDIICCFAALHHIPGKETRLKLLNSIHALLKPGGTFMFSVWQFQRSIRLKKRIQPWTLAIAINPAELDPGDYLLDWRAAGQTDANLRYVHVYTEEELAELASASQFHLVEQFSSDGKEGNLSDYQVWQK